MSKDTHKLKPKTNVLAKFKCGAGVQVIGVVIANGLVSLHRYDAAYQERRLPLIASDQDWKPEKPLRFSFGVEIERRINSFVDHYQRPEFSFEVRTERRANSFVDHYQRHDFLN
jgi:hypothetical protein